MSVHVGEMTSNVDVLPEARGTTSSSGPQASSATREEVERVRSAKWRLMDLEARTRAECFDD